MEEFTSGLTFTFRNEAMETFKEEGVLGRGLKKERHDGFVPATDRTENDLTSFIPAQPENMFL